jgi:hypothetical protein
MLMALLSGIFTIGKEFFSELLSVPKAIAQAHPWDFSINICTLFDASAPCASMPTIQANLSNFFLNAASLVSTAVFVLGALLMAMSGGKEQLLENGKRMMKGAVVAFIVIGGSYIILRAVTWLLYSG